MGEFRLVWGTIDPAGNVLSASEKFLVNKVDTGTYTIQFGMPFAVLPTITGSQVLFGSINENTLDNIIFPIISEQGFTAKTGDAYGNKQDRHFSFLALGV